MWCEVNRSRLLPINVTAYSLHESQQSAPETRQGKQKRNLKRSALKGLVYSVTCHSWRAKTWVQMSISSIIANEDGGEYRTFSAHESVDGEQ